MATFKETQDRILAELRRSNLREQTKNAINDAIDEACKTRFYFNEITVPITLVPGVPLYSNLRGLIEIDAAYYLRGTTRYNLRVENHLALEAMLDGNPQIGQPDLITQYGGRFYLDPAPSVADTLYITGFGRLLPFPLLVDADTNVWLNEGERYIRTLAKRNVIRDVVRDYGEARTLEAIAVDLRDELINETQMRSNTDVMKSTQF